MFETLPEPFVRLQFRDASRSSESPSDSDTLTLIRTALDAPLDYPAVREWVFPGDSVAIVLQEDIAAPQVVLRGVCEHLISLGYSIEDVSAVIAPSMAGCFGIEPSQLVQTESEIANGEPPRLFPVALNDENNATSDDEITIGIQVHDQANQYGLAYLAANAAGDAIHVNRRLVDADVLIPVGHPVGGIADDAHDCIYPVFGSTSRVSEYRKRSGSVNDRRAEIRQVGETLGSFFLVQVLTGPSGDIIDVVAGAREPVTDRCDALAKEIWNIQAIEHAHTAIATIESSGRDQTWDDFTNAVLSASQAASGSGPIIVWSELEVAPERGVRKAIQSQFSDTDQAKLSKTQKLLASVVAERPLFLRSNLPQSTVEELGMGYLADESDVLRIAEKADSGILIRNAHRVHVQPVDVAKMNPA